MILNIHAGHNPDGKTACGAVGLIKESTEARKVKDEVIKLLKQEKHTVYDCTVDNGISQSDVLNKIVSKCNAHKVDLDISIHFNSGANDKNGNNKTTGTEVYIYSKTSKSEKYAKQIVNKIAALGFKNRGIKTNAGLYVLKHTNAPSVLIECCFIDDKDDIKLYDYKKMAKAIVEGILNKTLLNLDKEITENKKVVYRVQCGAFSKREHAENLQKKMKKDGYEAIIVK